MLDDRPFLICDIWADWFDNLRETLWLLWAFIMDHWLPLLRISYDYLWWLLCFDILESLFQNILSQTRRGNASLLSWWSSSIPLKEWCVLVLLLGGLMDLYRWERSSSCKKGIDSRTKSSLLLSLFPLIISALLKINGEVRGGTWTDLSQPDHPSLPYLLPRRRGSITAWIIFTSIITDRR